uniref:Putative threonine efflux protein n=1 Tax=Desulfovibrio sp. U5L TaxID=596152 RepID=I2PWJ6_9BACT
MLLQTYPLYLAALAAGMLTPGPAMLQALTLGLRFGPRPVAVVACGNVCASVLQVLAALGGLSLLAGQPALLRVAGLGGAAYLAWLGLRLWRAPAGLAPAPVPEAGAGPATAGLPSPATAGLPSPATAGLPSPATADSPSPATAGPPSPATAGPPTPAALFGQGALVSLLNPKAWGFLAAMLPPFTTAGMPHPATVALLAGPIMLFAFGGMMAYACFGAWLTRTLASPWTMRLVFRLFAVTLWWCAAALAAG